MLCGRGRWDVGESAGRLAEWRSAPTSRRSREEVTRFFGGLEPGEPGVVPTRRWRPDPGIFTEEYEVPAWTAAGRKR